MLMDITKAKTEYDYLLGLYLYLSVFEPFTSTFTVLQQSERQELMLTISVLQRKLQEIMPKVQDREITKNSGETYEAAQKRKRGTCSL
jgi:hypothetical protein